MVVGVVWGVKAQAASSMESKILVAGVNSSDVVFVQFESAINESGCASAQLLIPPDSDVKEKILSLALAAKARNSVVVIMTNGCYGANPAILKSASDGAYFYVK